MKQLVYFFAVIYLTAIFTVSCDSSQDVAKTNLLPKPTATQKADQSADLQNQTDSDSIINQIKDCTPQKLYKGDDLTVSFHQPHGGYFAIQRLSDKKWFFLYEIENSSPVWSVKDFKELTEVKLNTETSVNSTNSEANRKAEKIFSQTSRYKIMVSDQDFGQDDPAWQGVCEVDFINQVRPEKK